MPSFSLIILVLFLQGILEKPKKRVKIDSETRRANRKMEREMALSTSEKLMRIWKVLPFVFDICLLLLM